MGALVIDFRVRRRSSRLFVATLLSGALLAGCGGDGEERTAQVPASTPAQPPAPAKGFRLATVSEHGFAIAVPKKWLQLPVDPARLRAALEANPRFGLDPDKPLPSQFLAYAKDGSGANVNVNTNRAGGAGLALVEADYANQLKPLEPTDVAIKRVQLPGGEALRGTYKSTINSQQGPVTTTTVQYILIRDDTVFIATITQVGQQAKAKLADNIGRTLFPI